MSIKARVEPLDRDIQVTLTEGLLPQAQSQMLVDFAQEALAEAQRTNRQVLGVLPEHEMFVDGRPSASFNGVKPNSRIIFEFELLDDLFAWIGEQLVRHSAARSGRYTASHLFFADGVEVAPTEEVPDAFEWVFLNSQPYARKIERGQSPQAPDGVYEVVAALARRRFGNLARIQFTYRSLADARNRNTRQPAIVITLGR